MRYFQLQKVLDMLSLHGLNKLIWSSFMVGFSLSPIMGMQIGLELTEGKQGGHKINYCLIDLLIIRFQIAWFDKNPQ